MIQVMVGASDPVRGPHPLRASGQEKEIQGGMVKKKGAEVLVAGVTRTNDPWLSALEILSFSQRNHIRCVARYAR